jgi:hypothetical protein
MGIAPNIFGVLHSSCGTLDKSNTHSTPVKDVQPVALLCLKEPAHLGPAVLRKFEQKLFLMAPMGYVAGVSRQEVPSGFGHV